MNKYFVVESEYKTKPPVRSELLLMNSTNSGAGVPRSSTYAGYLSRKNCYPIRVDPQKKWHDPVNIPSKYWDKLSTLDKTVLHLFADPDNLSVSQKKEHQKTFRNACSRLQQWFIRSDPDRYAEEKKRTTEYNLAVKRGEIEPIRGKYTRSSIVNRAMPVSMREFHCLSEVSDGCMDGEENGRDGSNQFSEFSLMVEPKFSASVGCLLNREAEGCFLVNQVAIPDFIFETQTLTELRDPFEQKPQGATVSGENPALAPISAEHDGNAAGAPWLPPMLT